MKTYHSHSIFWKYFYAVICAILLLMISLDVDSQEAIELENIEVNSGTPRSGAALKQAADISQIRGREKEKAEGVSLGETLEGLSGVSNISTGPQTGKPVIRGLSGNRIRILNESLSVDHQQFGVRHTPNIDPFFVDEIEVVRGSSSLLYGSDALGGAINIKNDKLDFTPESTFSGDTLFGFSSNNNQSDTGIKANWSDPKWSTNVGVIFRDAGNLETPDEKTDVSDRSDEPKFSGELDHTDFEQFNSFLGVARRTQMGDFKLKLSRWDSEQNFLLPNGKPIGQELVNNQANLSASIFAGSNWIWKPRLQYQNNIRKANKKGNGRDKLFDGTTNLEFDQYTTRLEGEHAELLGFDGGTVGIEYMTKDQESTGKVQLSPGGNINNFSAFAFEEKSFGALLLQTGLRHDIRDVTAKESKTTSDDRLFNGEDEKTFQETTGSFGASYELSKSFILAANLARGFRAPTLFELFAKGVHGGVAAEQRGEPQLESEKSFNTDLSLRWVHQESSVKLTGYRNQIKDYIFLEDTGQTTSGGDSIFQHVQSDAILTGVELDSSWQIIPELNLEFQGHFVDGENDDTGDDLPLIPANHLKLGMTYQFGDSSLFKSPYFGFSLRHVFSKDAAPREPFAQFDSKPFGTASTEDYTLVDVSLGTSFKFKHFMNNRAIRLDLRVKNIADETYRDFLDTYKGYALGTGRDIEIRLRIPFGG